MAIVRKTFDNHDKDLITNPSNFILTLNKFALKAYNLLSHNREMSGLLVASYLLNLPDHYSPKAIVKSINIALMQAKFSLILDGQSFNQSDNIVHVDSTKVWPCLIYKHYAYRS